MVAIPGLNTHAVKITNATIIISRGASQKPEAIEGMPMGKNEPKLGGGGGCLVQGVLGAGHFCAK